VEFRWLVACNACKSSASELSDLLFCVLIILIFDFCWNSGHIYPAAKLPTFAKQSIYYILECTSELLRKGGASAGQFHLAEAIWSIL